MPRLHHLDTDRGYAVIMPSASRDDKLWPEDDWRAVFRRLRDAGCALKLLAGNDQEAERARLLVAGMEDVEVMPRMDLTPRPARHTARYQLAARALATRPLSRRRAPL
ncbi:glycosyltransferase family 9 protein [Lactiplantibacillus plantarum]|uniref:glycosyltransferase family 9 protein n=1 Tax=Lactiplantibacillus plantarum TaxID=1590 RepID=UPI00404601A1